MAVVMTADATIQARNQTTIIKTIYVIAPCSTLWAGIELTIFFHKGHLSYGLLLRHKFQTIIRCWVSTR